MSDVQTEFEYQQTENTFIVEATVTPDTQGNGKEDAGEAGGATIDQVYLVDQEDPDNKILFDPAFVKVRNNTTLEFEPMETILERCAMQEVRDGNTI